MNRKPLSKKMRFEIFERDNFTCQYCGRQAPKVELQVDHILPVSRGGKNNKDNLITACVDCNIGKSDAMITDSYDDFVDHIDYVVHRDTEKCFNRKGRNLLKSMLQAFDMEIMCKCFEREYRDLEDDERSRSVMFLDAIIRTLQSCRNDVTKGGLDER